MRARVIQLGIGGVIVLGLATAAILRAPAGPSAVALSPVPTPPNPSVSALGASEPNPGLAPPAPDPAPSATATPALLDEASLMGQLRSLANSGRPRAIELAREGNQRFPNSADAPERASILIHSLAREGYPAEARREAEGMVNQYPDSSWVREVELFTGAHRHRNLRLNADGGLEYY
jgi:hypothetical protein